ncbi:MAG: hypothetical protein UW22_C0006G0045 [Candidatus Gottesmanbacteria bacterium GW2011_GWB1_44_11c]|uniref:Uncharacterized protein n=1 Tax=Candidatus Gottesmanbacteria bacterium GW2011_GWB1_44_11c TaxID=1618447 RepID=A0A0G1JTH9_9BACT|nr:MAG: hypothetical protein UW22_C0006G0045 [Candidatus Gottesmanbacteria bacterium GW2011_GWB1_44_11c]
MITDADVTKLKKTFATKDDLKRFATKDDLKRFATKDDLKRFATKDDLKALEARQDNKFASKDDLKKTEKSMRDTIVDFKDEILHEIKGFREEIAIVIGYKDHIEDVDYRVERLEKFTKIPPISP